MPPWPELAKGKPAEEVLPLWFGAPEAAWPRRLTTLAAVPAPLAPLVERASVISFRPSPAVSSCRPGLRALTLRLRLARDRCVLAIVPGERERRGPSRRPRVVYPHRLS